MMTIPYTQILVLIAFAVFFHRAAEMEEAPSWIWSALSILISVLTIFWLHWGWLGIILGQVGLFVGITVIRILRKS
jgi:hypothetical protein